MPEPIQLTDAERAEYEQRAVSSPLNPIKDFSAQELADLSARDTTFDLVGEFRLNQDLWADPTTVQKVADAHNKVRQRGFQLSDVEAVQKAKEGNVGGAAIAVAKPVAHIGKGFLKQAWNYANAAAMPFIDIVGDITGQGPGFSEALAQEGQRRVAENLAGTEAAVTGLSQLPGKALGKFGRATGLTKPLEQFTPEEKAADLWDAVGKGEVAQDIARGHGGFLGSEIVGKHVISELEQANKQIRPEETAQLAQGDPFSWWAFGRGFHALGKTVPPPVARVVAKGEQLAGELAAKAGGKLVQGLGATTEKVVAPTLKATGKVAEVGYPIAAAGKALATGDFSGVFQHTAGGYFGGKALQRLGEGAKTVGAGVREFGKQVAGEVPVTSNLAQLSRDVLQATPGAAIEVGKGVALDLGLGAATSESPAESAQALGIGTVFGALGAGRRVGGRVLSGQLIAPRDYGIKTPVASSGQFPVLDSMHQKAFSAAEPAQQARLNAIREFAKGAAPGSDIFMGDTASIEAALTQSGVSPEQARQFAQNEGFFTTDLVGKDGKPRRVVIVKDVAAAPHEAFHVIQDVLGEPANRQIDATIKQAYADRWDAEGNDYAQRLVGPLGEASWQEAILDASGWGANESKEKLYRDIGNSMRAESGAEPNRADVRARAQQEFGQRLDEALARNSHLTPEQAQARVWRDILTPEEARGVADRYIARELAAENFDALFKHTGGKSGTPAGVLPFLAEKVGQVVTALGGNPLEGRTSEFGEVPLRPEAVQAVRGAAEGQLPEVKIPSAAPRAPAGSPEAAQQEAQSARELAASAPETPLVAGGTKSARELLGQIAEAISTRTGVKLNYLSAPDQPAAAISSNREVRRSMIEAFRTMPPEARALWEKSFFPERVIKTKGGQYQVQGWAPEVFAANAHRMAETLAKAKAENLSPYEIDPTLQTFTPASWQQLYTDAQVFINNQQAGRTGAGEPLVVPKEITEKGFFAPQVKPGAEVPLAQRNADFINMLFGFKLPETPRIQKGKLPLNVAGVEVSAATKPGRVSVPVRPRGEFTGAEAERQGIAGRPIEEVNPVRAEIERAAQAAGVAAPSMIEAIQKLNLENIKEIEGAPELPEFRGNTLTLTAGFQPRSAKEIELMTPDEFRGWASKLPQGFTGAAHDMGRNVPSVEDARELRAAYDRLSVKTPRVIQEARDAMASGNQELAMKKMDESAAVASQAQFFREAAEAAEGTGSAGMLLRRQPGYVPPFPIEPLSGQAQPRYFGKASEEAKAAMKEAEEIFKGLIVNDPAAQKRWNDVVVLANTSKGKGAEKEHAKAVVEWKAHFQETGEHGEFKPLGSIPNETSEILQTPGVDFISAARTLTEESDKNWYDQVGGSETIQSVLEKVGKGLKPEDWKTLSRKERSVLDSMAFIWKFPEEYARINKEAELKRRLFAQRAAEGKYDALQKFMQEPEKPERKKFLGIFQPKRAEEELSKIRSGESFGQTFNRDGSVWTPPKEPTDIVTLASVNIPADQLTPEKMAESLAPYSEALDKPGVVAGVFRFEKDGKQMVSIDVNATVPQEFRDNSIAFAKANNQISIWDATKSAEVPTGGSGETRLKSPEQISAASEKLTQGESVDVDSISGQAQPAKRKQDEFAFRPGSTGGFSKAWILPGGKVEQLGGMWHHDWLDRHPEVQKKYGFTVPKFEGTDAEGVREASLQKGLVRINYNSTNGRMVVEARASDWPKQKSAVEKVVERNLDDIDNLQVTLLDDKAADVVDRKTARLFQLDTDAEKLAAIPFLEGEARAARAKVTDNPAFAAPGEEEAPALKPDVLPGNSFAVYSADGRYIGKYFKPDEAVQAAGEGGSVVPLKGQAQPLRYRTRREREGLRRTFGGGGYFMEQAKRAAEAEKQQAAEEQKPVEPTVSPQTTPPEQSEFQFQPPRIPTDEQIESALSKDKVPYIGAARELEPGTPVGVRIDIPAFLRNGTYVQTVHERKQGQQVGKRIGYDSIVTVDDPVFFSNEVGAKKILEGAEKFPIATVEGAFNTSRELPEDLDTWTEVGFNPHKHSYFYEKGTDRLVESGDQAISVGNSVFVRNAVFGDASKAQFQPQRNPRTAIKYFTEEQKPVVTGTGFRGRPTLWDAAKFLSEQNAKIGKLGRESEADLNEHASALADEAEFAFSRDPSAVGWYDDKITQMTHILEDFHPELKTDPNAFMVYKALMAINSNGQAIDHNLARSEMLYQQWKKEGTVDTEGAFGGKNAPAINAGMRNLMELIKAKGLSGAREFLETDFSVGDLKKLGYAIPGELVSTKVKGSVILGPKIGSFYGNLNGDFSSITMDRWFMRTFNRIGGTLTAPAGGPLPKQIQSVLDAFKGRRSDMGHDLGPIREALDEALAGLKTKTMEPEEMQDKNSPLGKWLYDRFRAYESSGFADRSAQNTSVKNLYENLFGTENGEKPGSGSDRAWVRRVMSEAQRQLRERGINLTNADLQALLWYYEKELFAKLYPATKRSSPTDYARAAERFVAEQRGQQPRQNQPELGAGSLVEPRDLAQ